jgi:hypothetical protein
MSGKARVELTGGCQCGAVRYRLEARPTGENICHCRMCQKAGGAPFMVFAGVPLANLVWTRGAPKVFTSSAIAERGFCGDCGTPLTYRVVGRDRVSVTIGSLDRPSDMPPKRSTASGRESPGSIWFQPCPSAISSLLSAPPLASGRVSIRITTLKELNRGRMRRRERQDDRSLHF